MPREARTTASAGDVTSVAGIGAQTAARLRAAGIKTVDQLSRATVDQVVAACGPGLAPTRRAASWIQQAAALAGTTGTNGAAPARSPKRARNGAARSQGTVPPRIRTVAPARRTFTVEVRVEGDPARPATTHVVHLETKQSDGWTGWDGARLLEFMERRMGAVEPVAPPEPAAAVPQAEIGSTARLTLHRVGLLAATAPLTGRGHATARLRLDPAELELPKRGAAVARVALLARPHGGQQELVLDRRTIDLVDERAVDAQMQAQLPDQEPPFALSAIVRVLVEQPTGRPREGLGGAVLEVVAGNGAG
ncbi:MAG TPA: helix-hairpin-helix domain-containing protein [Jatrophihabitans sp.]|nr:helix-hairpin-helix domain-containing protein [Jatrophihabitans sp.]